MIATTAIDGSVVRFTYYTLAVLVATWFGGRRAGWLTLELSSILAAYQLISQQATRDDASAWIIPWLSFIAIGLLLVHLDRRLQARDLDGGRLPEEVGQRVDRPEEQGDRDDDIAPDWISVHSYSGAVESRAARWP